MTHIHLCHFLCESFMRGENWNPFEQGEAFLCGTLPWPRWKGDENKEEFSNYQKIVQIENLTKLVRLGSWEVGLRIGWTLLAGAIFNWTPLLILQIDSSSQTLWPLFGSNFYPLSVKMSGGRRRRRRRIWSRQGDATRGGRTDFETSISSLSSVNNILNSACPVSTIFWNQLVQLVNNI